jgi:flavin reductase (DIM6/NTAB) family NADH-FMN oxidoreductase RutF
MALDPSTFRSVLGRFASGVTVVTVVTVRDGRTCDYGLTVSAFCSLSLDPPLVLVCVSKSASGHEALLGATHFAVNVLSESQEPLSRRFSAKEERPRFEGVGFTRGAGGQPLLEEALAHLACRTAATHDGGDHTIFVGEVEEASAAEERPLLYYRGGYARLER